MFFSNSFEHGVAVQAPKKSAALHLFQFFPQQQNAKGSLHNIDFGVFWASWGGSGKELGAGTGSGGQVLRFREPVPGTGYAFRWFRQVLLFQGSGFSFRETGFRTRGIAKVLGSEGCVPEVSKVSVFDEFRRVRFCSQGLDGTGSGNRVPGTRGIKKVPGFGDSVAKVPKVALYLL